MKVKEFMRKVNAASAKLPVYLCEGVGGKERKAETWDFGDYYYDEKDRTVMSISLEGDRVVVYYK